MAHPWSILDPLSSVFFLCPFGGPRLLTKRLSRPDRKVTAPLYFVFALNVLLSFVRQTLISNRVLALFSASCFVGTCYACRPKGTPSVNWRVSRPQLWPLVEGIFPKSRIPLYGTHDVRTSSSGGLEDVRGMLLLVPFESDGVLPSVVTKAETSAPWIVIMPV